MAALSGALGNEGRRWSLAVEGSGEKGSWEPLPRGCQQWTSGFLAVMYILAHLATWPHPSAFSTQNVTDVARCLLEKWGGKNPAPTPLLKPSCQVAGSD